jgi:hypothetical protein
MGWMNVDHPEHEGWAVALQKDERSEFARDGYFRELGYPKDDKDNIRVDAVQAGCDCGWRSARFKVLPGDVEWMPFVALCSPTIEERIHTLWRAHIDGLADGREDQVRRAVVAAFGPLNRVECGHDVPLDRPCERGRSCDANALRELLSIRRTA